MATRKNSGNANRANECKTGCSLLPRRDRRDIGRNKSAQQPRIRNKTSHFHAACCAIGVRSHGGSALIHAIGIIEPPPPIVISRKMLEKGPGAYKPIRARGGRILPPGRRSRC